MSKSKWSAEFRAQASQEYLDGKGSAQSIANKYQIGRTTLQKWESKIKQVTCQQKERIVQICPL